jgi:hypothetical protein
VDSVRWYADSFEALEELIPQLFQLREEQTPDAGFFRITVFRGGLCKR